MSRKHRAPDLAGWFEAAANSEAGKQRKRRRATADFYGTVKPSRLARRKGRGR